MSSWYWKTLLFIDALDLEDAAEISADICIVGAGAAGIALALELMKSGRTVALMEAGGLESDDQAQALYAGKIEGLNYTPLEAARIRYFGGTTNHWSGWCWPLDPIDFEKRDWMPNSGWPISRADLDPYYLRAQPYCEIGKDDFSLQGWASEQEPALNAPGLESRLLKFSPPTRFGLKFRPQFAASERVAVYLNATLLQLETTATGERVTAGMFACGLGSRRCRVLARHFVLASGGIENAKLLLQSRDTHERGLGNRYDLVGRYFADHPGHARGLVLFNDPEQNLSLYKYHRQLPTLKEKITDGGSMAAFLQTEADRQSMLDWIEAGADEAEYQRVIKPIVERSCLACHNSAGIAFFRNFETFSGLREVALRPSNMNPGAVGYSAGLVLSDEQQRQEEIGNARTMLADRGSWSDLFADEDFFESVGVVLDNFTDLSRAVYNRALSPESKRTIGLMRCAIEPVPNPESRITLTEERDALGQPGIALTWKLTEQDKRTFERTETAIGRALGSSGIGRLLKAGDLNDADWGNTLNHGWHHMGTTRMHASPRSGVVDERCRVHGVANLHIAGSSVFPTYGYANPTLTIVALALRLADDLTVGFES